MTERSFTIVRTIDATPEQVFSAWTEPAKLGWFFAEPEAENEAPEVDLRVGGAWRQLMVIDEDDSYVTGGIYRDIESAMDGCFGVSDTVLNVAMKNK